MKMSGRGEHHCRECTNAKKEVSRHLKRKESLTQGEKLMKQPSSLRVKLSSLSPYSKKQMMRNISQSRRNLKRAVERYRKKFSVKLNDEQAEEIQQLVSCIESDESGFTLHHITYVCLYREPPSIPEVSLTGVPVVKRVS